MSNQPATPAVAPPEATPPPAAGASLATALNARLAPQDPDAERSVLGGILLTNPALDDVADLLAPDDFYRDAHRRVYAAMLALAERREPIDILTLADELKRRGEFDAVGGATYISSLDAATPATANLAHYATIVRDKARVRRVIVASHAIARDGYEQKGDVSGFLDSAEQRLLAATEQRDVVDDTRPVSAHVRAVFEEIEARYNRGSEVTGLATGFRDLDRLTTGLRPGQLVVVAGRPAMGKTALATQIAWHVCASVPSAVFSLEMSVAELLERLLSLDSGVPLQRLRTGRLGDPDWTPLAKAAQALASARLVISDAPHQSVREIAAKARRIRKRYGSLGLVVVDYLQLMRGAGEEQNREQEIAGISRGLKALAKDLACPVLALSQLNRDCEKRSDKRPLLSDLRESGSVEQDADVVAFVYRDEVYDKHSKDKGVAEVILAKQRNGPTGTVRLAFLGERTKFADLAEENGWG